MQARRSGPIAVQDRRKRTIWQYSCVPTRPRYQEEPSDLLRSEAFDVGRLSPLSLFRIAAWKSARGLASLTLNSEADISAWTAVAVEAIRPWRHADVLANETDWDAWQVTAATAVGRAQPGSGLLALDGVGYPMATAILAFLAPGAFPVIDRWTTKAVFGVDKVDGTIAKAAVYRRFAQRLTEVRALYPGCRSIHELDQAIMNEQIALSRQPSATPPTFEIIGVNAEG